MSPLQHPFVHRPLHPSRRRPHRLSIVHHLLHHRRIGDELEHIEVTPGVAMLTTQTTTVACVVVVAVAVVEAGRPPDPSRRIGVQTALLLRLTRRFPVFQVDPMSFIIRGIRHTDVRTHRVENSSLRIRSG